MTKPTEVWAGRPKRSIIQAPAISSIAAADGVSSDRPAFWSQLETSQSAAMPGRGRAADHEAEETPALGRDESRFGLFGQGLDDLDGARTLLGQLAAQCCHQLLAAGCCAHLSRREAVQKVDCRPVCRLERAFPVRLVHVSSPLRVRIVSPGGHGSGGQWLIVWC